MTINNDIEEVLNRGVGALIDPDNTFRNKLEKKIEGKYEQDIVIKLGVDPTRPDIHLGHAVILRRLRQFQDLGCKVIFLVGDFTAQIGDPSGKSKIRPEISGAEVEANMRTFVDQVGKILRTEPNLFSWIANSDWFVNITDIMAGPSAKVELDGKQIDPNSFVGKAVLYENTRLQKTVLKHTSIQSVSLIRFMSILRNLTHSRLIDRDMFEERFGRGEELYMHELMYPVLQGVDSAVIAEIYGSCDLEIGGTDQTFNMLVGRDVMKMSKLSEQSVMALEILPGLDGKEKMSKSSDNYIAITDSSDEMFGKVMSLPDSALPVYFRLATYTAVLEILEMEKKLAEGKLNPRDAKLRLAREIVATYHGEREARVAEENFINTFTKNVVPKDMETLKFPRGAKLADIVISNNLVASKTEWRRLVKDGAISNQETGEKISSPDADLEDLLVLRIGKHRFIRIEPQ